MIACHVAKVSKIIETGATLPRGYTGHFTVVNDHLSR